MKPKIEYDNKFKGQLMTKAGKSQFITTNISGIPQPTIKWFKGEEPLEASEKVLIDTGMDFSTVTIKDSKKDDSAIYKITAENEVGSDEATFDLKVQGTLNF